MARMRSHFLLTMIRPRSAAFCRHLPVASNSISRSSGAPICDNVPATTSNAAADGGRRSRHMSVNTRGSSPRSPWNAKLETEGEEENRFRRAREYLQNAVKGTSASTSAEYVGGGGSESSANEAQREALGEKQSDTEVDFQAVRDAPAASNQQWWYPDPFTGHFVPQSSYGEISSTLAAAASVKEEQPVTPAAAETINAQVLQKVNPSFKKAPAPSPTVTKLTGIPSKGEKGGWWTSMEELPDMDHFHMRA
ncbi:hypothetical protein R1flu_026335 [Riccia fluitans]|uniref:Uncharacterized protein n=1 Tax=Riccia fluitans TaxID=41844 RepID=A0ABD1XFP0_9MARC